MGDDSMRKLRDYVVGLRYGCRFGSSLPPRTPSLFEGPFGHGSKTAPSGVHREKGIPQVETERVLETEKSSESERMRVE